MVREENVDDTFELHQSTENTNMIEETTEQNTNHDTIESNMIAQDNPITKESDNEASDMEDTDNLASSSDSYAGYSEGSRIQLMAMDCVEQAVPELNDYSKYISEKSNDNARFTMQAFTDLDEIYRVLCQRKF
ncbi:hypothetical protein [Anaerosporobacter sp.]|uniref:hypothetical protein n=1 Tax=Anaerosporobacter sp. TaxID=1872529 RepID=UPI00286EB64B|nr:hypothetical protein [Anaerosporobacter sp.]